MAIVLNHVLVPTHDKEASARFFADLFGLRVVTKDVGVASGVFAIVRVGDTHLDFGDIEIFEPHHYAFLVNDEEFDAILARVKEKGIAYSADPKHNEVSQINHLEGGRGVYFRELNGHNLELLTRPQAI